MLKYTKIVEILERELKDSYKFSKKNVMNATSESYRPKHKTKHLLLGWDVNNARY